MAVETTGNTDHGSIPKNNGPRKTVFLIILVVAILLGTKYGYGKYTYGKDHVETDDAYITGELVYISPSINGTLAKLEVDEGDRVKKGQLIARLKDSSQQSALRQAQAAYNSALTQIPQAKSNLAYQKLATEAAIQKARAAISSQRDKTKGAKQQVDLTSDTFRYQVAQSRSQVAAAEATVAQFAAQALTAKAGIDTAKQAVASAESSARAVDARILAAQADLERSTKDEARYKELVAQEAISKQQFDAVHAQTESYRANLTAARELASQATSQVEQAKEGVKQATATWEASKKSTDAARQQIQVAKSGLNLAESSRTNIAIQRTNVTGNIDQSVQAQADLSTAEAGNEQIALRAAQVDTANAQLDQARAQLVNAQIMLEDTYIYAPTDGNVVKKTANVGTSLAPGQTILTMTQGDKVWVEANFKETQLKEVQPGQSVEVEVDTYSGKQFAAHVQSINRATGAATSLLPPDNATGNFTKVVQRIPVRIVFDKHNSEGDDPTKVLRQGMSAAVTINLRSQVANP